MRTRGALSVVALRHRSRARGPAALQPCDRAGVSGPIRRGARRLARSRSGWRPSTAQYFLAGGAAHNHAFAAGLQGDIVTALASFARADESVRAGRVIPGRSAGVLASDRCELMLAAGLHDEAPANAELAVRSLDDVDDVNDLAEARLLLARACLAQGDGDRGPSEAAAALDQFAERVVRVGPRWPSTSPSVRCRCRLARAHSRTSSHGLTLIAARLERLGWAAESALVRVSSAELAIELGDAAFARSQLRSPPARVITVGPIGGRAHGWRPRCCGGPTSTAPARGAR